MVRFFFDVAREGVLSPDDTGLEFPSNELATREGATALLEMARGLARSGNGSIAMVIRNGSGARVCTLTVTLSVAY